MDLFQAVKEFHEAFDLPISREPILPSGEVSRRRYNLIREELRELKEAMAGSSKEAIAKELTDLLYVVIGTYLELGLHPLAESLMREVHRSNMSKLVEHEPEAVRFAARYTQRTGEETEAQKTGGGHWRIVRCSDGKVIKPDAYRPADTRKVLVEFYQAYLEGLRQTGQAVPGLPQQEPGQR